MSEVNAEEFRVVNADSFEAMESQLAALREELEKFDEGMRALACSLGAGGYNAETLTADQLVGKVQWGIDNIITVQEQRLADAERRNAELEAMLDTPHTDEWFEGVKLEAGHQIKRWGSEHDAGKGPADWFWLIGYLAQKAMTSQMLGNEEKAKHHTISTGAALLNWFRAITGESNAMRPGIDDTALKPNPEAASHDE
jgi:hypothetical protein